MPRKNESRQIGDCTYEVTQLGGIAGRKVFGRLVKLLGGAVGALSGIKENGPDAMVAAFKSLAENLDDQTIEYLCTTFDGLTQVHLPSGKTPNLRDVFDDHFAANYGDMVSWLVFCLEVNFGSFLGARVGSGGFAPPATGTQ